MTKPRGLDVKLNRVRALRHEPLTPGLLAELRSALGDASNVLVAEAAQIAGDRVFADLTPDLVAAFERLMVEAETSDPLCRGKLAIVEALNKLDCQNDDVFLRGIRHVQMEPGWPRATDVGAPLRGSSAFGLVRMHHHGVVLLLAELLADSEKVARCAAAQALGASRSPAAFPLLRYKARIGDEEPEVVAECLTALMTADPDESLEFVAPFLDAPDEGVSEGAAFALAEARRPEALAILLEHWPKARSVEAQEVLLLAISMTRLPAALDFLVQLLTTGNSATALGVLSALKIHRHNPAVKTRVAAAVAAKGERVLQERYEKKFGGGD